MYSFSNIPWTPLALSYTTLFLMIVPGVYEYLTKGRKRRIQDVGQFDYKNRPIGEKELVLRRIAILRKHSNGLEAQVKQRIAIIEREVNEAGTGIVASHLPHFWKIKLDEIQKISEHVDAQRQKVIKHTKRNMVLGFLFLSLCTYIFVGISTLHLTSLNEIKVGVWLLFGTVFICVMFLLSMVFMILFSKTFTSLAPFAYYISKTSQMILTYAITKFFIYIYIAINVICFSFAYKFVYPSVSSAFSNVVTVLLQVFTVAFILIEIIAIISSPISTLDLFFDLLDNRAQKKKE